MNFTSQYDVRFKIMDTGGDRYLVKYYPKNSRWPKIFKSFRCTTDEHRREMFYILGHSRFCEGCHESLLGYRQAPEVSRCQQCILNQAAQEGMSSDTVPECPVCFQKMLHLDGTRKTLACQHALCTYCCRRMIKPTTHIHYDPRGPMVAWTIKCPLCRDQGLYDSALNILPVNSTF